MTRRPIRRQLPLLRLRNRQQLWQECLEMFRLGAFGDPAGREAQLLLWTKLELLHYPGAADTKEYLEGLQSGERARQVEEQAKKDAWETAMARAMG